MVLRALRDQGIDIVPMHIKSLFCINRLENCTSVDISDALGRDKAQITRLIKELIEKELVHKIPNPNDKRSQLIELTSHGESSLKKVLAIEATIIEKMHQGMSKEQINQFEQLSRQMLDNLQGG
jgi:DNA-binding MarR family transcriptional regulator